MVELTPEAAPIRSSVPKGTASAVIHWHGDTFADPRRRRAPGHGDRYPNQAFRYGRLVYGLQFHIEVDDAMAEAGPGPPGRRHPRR